MHQFLRSLGFAPRCTLPAKKTLHPREIATLGEWSTLLIVGDPTLNLKKGKIGALAHAVQSELRQQRALLWIDEPEHSAELVLPAWSKSSENPRDVTRIRPDEDGYYPAFEQFRTSAAVTLLEGCLKQAPNNQLQDRTLNSELAKLLRGQRTLGRDSPMTLVVRADTPFIRETLLLALSSQAQENNLRVIAWVPDDFKPSRLMNELARHVDCVVAPRLKTASTTAP